MRRMPGLPGRELADLRAQAAAAEARAPAPPGALRGGPLRAHRARQAARDVVEAAATENPFSGRRSRPSPASRPCPCSSKSAACPRARRSKQRSTPAPTWWGSCSFRRRRGTSRWRLARDLGRQVKRRALKVALTVDADDATLDNIMDALSPDILQLHGKESVARLRDIKQRFGRPVMKAVPVATAADLAVLPATQGRRPHPVRCAGAEGRDASRRPRAPSSTGTCSKTSISKLPYMVSGGLDADNVAEALRVTARRRRRRLLRRRERARRQGSRDDQAPSFAPRAQAKMQSRVERLDEHRQSPIPTAAAPTSAAISAFSADASSPKP